MVVIELNSSHLHCPRIPGLVDERLLDFRVDIRNALKQRGTQYSVVMARCNVSTDGDAFSMGSSVIGRLQIVSISTKYFVEFTDPTDAVWFKLSWC